MLTTSVVVALLGLASSSYAASNVNKKCQSNVCYSLNIPDSSTSSQGTVYYQITGPTSYAWIGMGTGSSMSGSNMFLIYQSANGQNVTLSPRKASGHNTPSPDSTLQATLMDGSGIVNGQMVANIRCSNCATSNSNFIYAANSGSLKSDSTSASISQHQNTYGTFSFDVASAKGGSDANPFAASTPSTTTGSTGGSGSACRQNSGSSSSSSGDTTSAANPSSTAGGRPPWFGGGTHGPPRPTGSSKMKRADDDCSDTGSGLSQSGASNKMSSFNMKLMAHGIMAGLAFAVLFPFGAISIRLFSFPGLVWFHAGIQIVSQIIFIIALALGVSIANELQLMSAYHPIIGIVLFVLLVIQPVLGQMHHRAFKRVGHRTGWSHGHLWLGRIIITLGIINGGLGFMLANNTNVGPIAYAVVAAIFYVAYVAAAIIGERRKARAMPPKYSESSRGSGPASPREFYNRPQDYEMPPTNYGRR